LLPVGAEGLVKLGHRVLVQSGAGLGSGLPDHEYLRAGAGLVGSPESMFAQADLIIKVKELQPEEWSMIRSPQAIFAYFHFAASCKLSQALIDSGGTCVAYETLEDPQGRLPLLTTMSEVAGRMNIQEGEKFLVTSKQGRGILLGGVPGVAPALITILGGGIVGANAAKIGAGFPADVTILDIDVDRLRYLDDIMPPNVNVLFSDRHTIREQLAIADLVIGAVLIPDAKATRLIMAEDLRRMKAGSVIIDVAIDQGGCTETSRPTTHSVPTCIEENVVHYCLTNMPGAVGRTSVFAPCNVTLPWALTIANETIEQAAAKHPPLAAAINIHRGDVTNEAVAGTFDLPLVEHFC